MVQLMKQPPAETAFEVRPAALADVPILARHRCEMFMEMGSLAESAYADLLAAAERYFAEALPAGEYHAWLVAPQARPEQIVAGGGLQLRRMLPRPGPEGLLLPSGPQGLILNMYTEPAWRRRGLASLLMETMIQWSRDHGVASLVLHASSMGRPLYEQLGFADTNEMSYPLHG